MKQISKTKADLGLVSVTIFWGTTFILSKNVLEEISLASYLAVRLVLAAVFMSIYALPHRRKYNSGVLKHGIILGFLLFSSYVFQMGGIRYTSASNAGFITGLNVVLVPLFSVLFFRDRPRLASLIGVAFATFGLFLLSGGNFSNLTIGDWLVFVCAIVVTFHVILTGRYAPKHNIYLLTAIQLNTVALLSTIYAAIDGIHLPSFSGETIVILVYLALFGTVYTFLMQTSMQRFTTATRTALVFALEPVFAALFAYLIGGETLTMLGWVGGSLIIAGMIVAEVDWGKLSLGKCDRQ
jgi:drug/metabolite transporter (DMT)-like permease